MIVYDVIYDNIATRTDVRVKSLIGAVPPEIWKSMKTSEAKETLLRYYWGPHATLADYDPVVVTRAEGCSYWDEHGNEYLDAVSGVAVTNLGHSNREVLDAVKRQLEKVTFAYTGYSVGESTAKLLKRFVSLFPSPLDNGRVMLLNSGSEANDFAIRIARAYHFTRGDKGKYRFIGRWISYHGATLSLGLSGHPIRRSPQEPLMPNFPMVDPPYCYRCPWNRTYPGCDLECARAVENCIKRENPDTISGYMCEVIGGMSGGYIVPVREYYSMVKEICEKYNVLIVDDEVINGFGRTGKMWAFQHYDFVPDILTTGKGMGCGVVPVSATIASSRVTEPIRQSNFSFEQASTYGGNPLAAAAALANIEVLSKNNLVEKAASLGEYMMKQLQSLEPDHRIIGDLRGKGLSIGIELVKNKETKEMFKGEAPASDVARYVWEKHRIKIFGTKGPGADLLSDFIGLFPPLVISKSQIDRIVHAIDEGLTEVEKTV